MNPTTETVACIGGIVLDRKARVPGGARPGTSNPVSVTTATGGVASNIARNLAHLGCRVSLFSILGDDDSGSTVLRDLENSGVDATAIMRSRHHPTASYTAVLEPTGELFIGLADMDIFEDLDSAWADRMAQRLAECSVWVVDTNLPGRTIERLLLTHKGRASVLADPISIVKSERIRSSLAAVDVLFPNRKEAAVLTGLPAETPEEIAKAAAELRRVGVGTVVVTLGGEASICILRAMAACFARSLRKKFSTLPVRATRLLLDTRMPCSLAPSTTLLCSDWPRRASLSKRKIPLHQI